MFIQSYASLYCRVCCNNSYCSAALNNQSVEFMISWALPRLRLWPVSSWYLGHLKKCSVVSSVSKHPTHTVSLYSPLQFIFTSIMFRRISIMVRHWLAVALFKYSSFPNFLPRKNRSFVLSFDCCSNSLFMSSQIFAFTIFFHIDLLCFSTLLGSMLMLRFFVLFCSSVYHVSSI